MPLTTNNTNNPGVEQTVNMCHKTNSFSVTSSGFMVTLLTSGHVDRNSCHSSNLTILWGVLPSQSFLLLFKRCEKAFKAWFVMVGTLDWVSNWFNLTWWNQLWIKNLKEQYEIWYDSFCLLRNHILSIILIWLTWLWLIGIGASVIWTAFSD